MKISVLTAIANDTGYENIFLNQLKIHYKYGDLFIVYLHLETL